MSTRLSVCLLTRDEERNIARAIRSLGAGADEVIVADTGSTDRTVEIARGLGAEVVPYVWDDDFSGGRNFAIGRATGDWVLWINPDEELVPNGLDAVRALTESGDDAFGYLARVQSVPRADRPDQFSETRDIRLFRRRPDLRYVGRLHPGLSRELAEAVKAEGLSVRDPGIVIRHHAYASVLDDSKVRWSVRLLERELSDRPGQLHYLIEYARNLLRLNDPRGDAVMAEASEQVAAAADAPEPPSPDVQYLLEYALTTPPDRNRTRITPERAVDLALRWYPDSPPLLWAMSDASFRAGQFAMSAGLLKRLVHLGATGSYDRSHHFDPRVIGSWALLNLGQCYRALGKPDEARDCFRRLLHDPEYGSQAAALLSGPDLLPTGGGPS